MDNSKTPTMSADEQSALITRLSTIAQERQVQAQQQVGGIHLEFADAAVAVSIDSEQSLIVFECTSPGADSADTLSTSMPLLAVTGENGAEHTYEFAEMMALLLGATSTSRTSDASALPEE